MKTVADFIFLGSEITADGDCSHEIKRRLLLRRRVITNLDSIFPLHFVLRSSVFPIKDVRNLDFPEGIQENPQ